ncbi:MAG: hypothetical protein WA840_22960 [Caulobacteraceae bacterium]
MIVAAVLLATPAAAKPVTAADAAQFQSGVATIADVTGKLGRPNADDANSDGTRTIRYVSISARPKAVSFVPIVGMFAGGSVGSSSSVSFSFGPDGKLKGYSTENTRTECGAVITGAHCGN